MEFELQKKQLIERILNTNNRKALINELMLYTKTCEDHWENFNWSVRTFNIIKQGIMQYAKEITETHNKHYTEITNDDRLLFENIRNSINSLKTLSIVLTEKRLSNIRNCGKVSKFEILNTFKSYNC